MLNPTQFRILTTAGGLAIAVALVNMYLFLGNRALQQQASQRAQYIQQSVALEGLYREIVQNLADRAVRTRDDEIQALLADQGVSVSFDAAPTTGSPP